MWTRWFCARAVTISCIPHWTGPSSSSCAAPEVHLAWGLPDSTGDAEYLAQLHTHLPPAFAAARPDLVIYLAGVDPLIGDRYGRLQLTEAGLQQRDRCVLATARQQGIPLLLLMSGGYAPTPRETARLHAIAHHQAVAVFCLPPCRTTSIFPTPP